MTVRPTATNVAMRPRTVVMTTFGASARSTERDDRKTEGRQRREPRQDAGHGGDDQPDGPEDLQDTEQRQALAAQDRQRCAALFRDESVVLRDAGDAQGGEGQGQEDLGDPGSDIHVRRRRVP
jgi:hypothetical protein